jgi:RNA polymerase sigma-70 factor (ECF subfamily)
VSTIQQAASTLSGASTANDPSEQALVQRARSGDHDAFGKLVEARLPSTLRTVAAILGNESDARDATQAIFELVWRSLPALRDAEAFSSWFSRIVVNTARTHIRSRRRRLVREVPVSVFTDDALPSTGGGTGHEGRTVELDRLERALDRISPAERTVLWLHHYEGLSLADIGSRLDVPPKTVKSRLFTARQALRQALQAEDR